MTGVQTRYPAATRSDQVDVLHGIEVCDPYRWLEDPDLPASATWIAEQQQLWNRTQADRPGRAWLARTLDELVDGGFTSRPRCYGGAEFFTRLTAGEKHAVLVVRRDGAERVLLDPNVLDPSGATVLEAWDPSWEGDLVAVQLSSGGSEDSPLRVLDAATGEVVDGPVDRVRRSTVAWLPGGRGFYYVRRLPPELHPGEERFHRRVHLHRLGTPVDSDLVVFGDGFDKVQFFGVAVWPAGPWLVVTAAKGAAPRRDVWIADVSDDLRAHNPELAPVQVGLEARTTARVPASSRDTGLLYLQTDLDAPRGRILTASLAAPDGPRTELVPEDPVAVLDDWVVLDSPTLAHPLLVVCWRRHAVSELAVLDLADGRHLGAVALPGTGVVERLSVDVADASRLFFHYTDPGTPHQVLVYDAATAETEVVGAVGRSPEVTTTQVTYNSADGTEVRMFILSGRGSDRRPRPAILTGYGGFGAVLTPIYQAEAAAWVAAGGIYVFAGLRGGGEEGADWHRDGMGLRKQNVFDDFRAAADHLVAHGWTTPAQLGILGSSNGGLLVGAALTQAPERFGAVVCIAPLLDMVRYESSGMGAAWSVEYGSAADPEQLANLHRYSPYHAVRDGVAYPPVLFAVFDGDSRVDLLHARKMCAALQHASIGERPVVLRTEYGVGHGSRALDSGLRLCADYLAFFADELGLELPAG